MNSQSSCTLLFEQADITREKKKPLCKGPAAAAVVLHQTAILGQAWFSIVSDFNTMNWLSNGQGR